MSNNCIIFYDLEIIKLFLQKVLYCGQKPVLQVAPAGYKT